MCMMMLGLVGAGVSAMGAMQQGQAKADADRRQAQEYRTNAQLQQRQASAEEIAGQFQQRRMQEKAGQAAATQITSFGAGGVTLDGSPTDTIIDSRRESALDIDAIKYNTDLKSDNLVFNARNLAYNAKSADAAADNDQAAGMMGAFSSLIGGVSKLGGTF